MPGVDYELLDRRLEHRGFGFGEWLWARELATIHAFLSTAR